MRTMERLRKMRKWLDAELCEGREFKCPKPVIGRNGQYGPDVTDFTMARPRVFLAWQPARPDEPGKLDANDPYSVAPAITIMPKQSRVRYVEERRFDRYQGVHRSQDMGQSLGVQILFTIYEPGVRWPGFADGMDAGNPDMSLFKDGTEPGLETLMNWLDDGMELFLRNRYVPETDLILEDNTFTYSLYTDQQYVTDRRPLYHAFLDVEFMGYANHGSDKGRPGRIDRLLDGYE